MKKSARRPLVYGIIAVCMLAGSAGVIYTAVVQTRPADVPPAAAQAQPSSAAEPPMTAPPAPSVVSTPENMQGVDLQPQTSLSPSAGSDVQRSQIIELLSLGEKYLLELNYEEAIVQFTHVVESDPENVRAYHGRGDAYAALELHAEAISDYEAALTLDMSLEEVYDKLVNFYDLFGTSSTVWAPDGELKRWQINGRDVLPRITIEIPRVPGLEITLENLPNYAMYQDIAQNRAEFKLYYATLEDLSGNIVSQTTVQFSKDVVTGVIQPDGRILPSVISAGTITNLSEFDFARRFVSWLQTGESILPEAQRIDEGVFLPEHALSFHAVDSIWILEDYRTTELRYIPLNLRMWEKQEGDHE